MPQSPQIKDRTITALIDIGQILADNNNLKIAMSQVIERLGKHHGIARGVVMLLDRESEELRVEASYGINEMRARGISYHLGEGIIGRVAQSSKPITAEQINGEVMFLEPLGQRKKNAETQELDTFCVPIIVNKKTAGVLGVDVHCEEGHDLDRTTKILLIVASMIAQAIKVKHLIAADRKRLYDENTHLKQELRERYDFSHIIGNSHPMRQLYEQITQVARANTTVLIRGESGSGKELIAHAIHYNSLRRNKPFVKVSCAALPETLIESELFGYEKGAFTGAQSRKKGRFELADGGTLFLDEIGDLNPSTQIKLLRVLQEREFERVGGVETVKTNVRLIAATHKELEEAITKNQFREDLFYRLNVFTIFTPPLRERAADVLLLAEHFLGKYAREHSKVIKRISTPAIDMLTRYHWPGNVRELENTIERAVLVCETNVLHGRHLPPTLQTAEGSGTVTRLSFSNAIEAYERDIIMDALKTTRGNRKKAAELLETTERVIGYKVMRYGIDCARFK